MRRGVASSREGEGSLTDPTSIQANQQGKLTGEQRDLLHLTSGFTFFFALGSAIVIIAIVAWAMAKQTAELAADIPAIPVYFWIVLVVTISAPLLYLGCQMLRSSRIRHELASGKIPSETGRIEWTGRRYRVAASLRGLRSIYGQLDVMPGRYQFYLLPGSRYLLSAEPLDNPESSRKALTDILGQVLGFTEADLAANREGSITMAQSARMRSHDGNVKPAFVEGLGERVFRSKRPAVIKSFIVNGERFDVSGRAYNAMVEGQLYRIYYMPLSRKILSMEAISPE